jgi:hypothetical protein
MMKIDFLAKLRIKNEVVSSDEKLRMLMPKFVLDRLNNFEMSSNLTIFSPMFFLTWI